MSNKSNSKRRLAHAAKSPAEKAAMQATREMKAAEIKEAQPVMETAPEAAELQEKPAEPVTEKPEEVYVPVEEEPAREPETISEPEPEKEPEPEPVREPAKPKHRADDNTNNTNNTNNTILPLSSLRRSQPIHEPAQPAAEKPAPKPKPEPAPKPVKTAAPAKPMTRQERKQEKRRLNDEEWDRIAAIPRGNLFQTVFVPAATMYHLSKTNVPTLSQFSSLLVNAVKWFCVGIVPARLIYDFINQAEFSTMRLNFTQASTIAAFVMLFGLVSEYFCLGLVSLYAFCTRRLPVFRRLSSLNARGSLTIAIIMAASFFLIRVSMPAAFALFGCGVVIALLLKGYAMDLTVKISKTEQLLLMAIFIFLILMAAETFFPLVNKELIEILKELLEI